MITKNMIKTTTLQKIDTKKITQFFSLGLIAIVLPMYFHNQLVTGPIINAILILTTVLVGIRGAVLLSLFPSVIALSGGLLPAMLAPVIPFIMIGNIIMVMTFDFLWNNYRNKIGFVAGVIVGSILKFSFLYFSVNVIATLLIKQELIIKVAKMMSSFQLTTALAGGVIALGVLKVLKKI